MRFSPGCGCCPSPSPSPSVSTIVDACLPCEVAPLKWSVTISGVTNDECLFCDNYNGTFILEWNAFNCRWQSGAICYCWNRTGTGGDNVDDSCVPTVAVITLVDFFGDFILDIAVDDLTTAGGVAKWVHPVASFDCLGPNTLEFSSVSTSGCSGWPSTLTITPA